MLTKPRRRTEKIFAMIWLSNCLFVLLSLFLLNFYLIFKQHSPLPLEALVVVTVQRGIGNST